MLQVIIYQNAEGGVSIIAPAQEYIDLYGIVAIAKKDVPAGKPYKIVDATDIPSDGSMQNAWTVNEADLTDGIGHVGNTFEEVLA